VSRRKGGSGAECPTSRGRVHASLGESRQVGDGGVRRPGRPLIVLGGRYLGSPAFQLVAETSPAAMIKSQVPVGEPAGVVPSYGEVRRIGACGANELDSHVTIDTPPKSIRSQAKWAQLSLSLFSPYGLHPDLVYWLS
jgi:hypothetical protein